jgi:hypothetical protein
MEFLLLAAIFFTSSGFLVGAAVALAPSAAVAQPSDPAHAENGTMTPQSRPKLFMLNAALSQQHAE